MNYMSTPHPMYTYNYDRHNKNLKTSYYCSLYKFKLSIHIFNILNVIYNILYTIEY